MYALMNALRKTQGGGRARAYLVLHASVMWTAYCAGEDDSNCARAHADVRSRFPSFDRELYEYI